MVSMLVVQYLRRPLMASGTYLNDLFVGHIRMFHSDILAAMSMSIRFGTIPVRLKTVNGLTSGLRTLIRD